MSLKKILLLCLFCLLCLFPLMDASAVSNIDYDIGSNGDGLDTSGSSSYCSVEQGCVHTINGNDYSGVRVTLVDDNGDIISGTHSMDFWNTIPYNARAKTGSKWRSYYINNYGSGLSSEYFTGVGGYVNSNVTDDTSLIGGINFKTQHELIENELNKEIENYKKTKKCEEFKLFSLLGYNDFCNDIKNPECEETLNKIYILVEPMYYVNYKKKNIAVTGTELAAMIYNTRINKGDNYSTANLNRSAFDNAITNMYLTGKDAQYDFKANNKVYNNFDAYASGLSDINIINYYNSSEEAKKVLKAAIGYSNDLYPLGNSMHLVWLGTWAGEVCEPKGCCIPCSVANVEGCDEDDCCYDEDLPISTDGTTEACIPFDEYWDGHDDEHDWDKVCGPKCIPTPSNNHCCDEPGWCDLPENYEYCNEYCEPKTDCGIKDFEPEVIVNYCDEDNENNISYFRDGVFNSKNGQFKDYSIEKIEEEIEKNGGRLPSEWITKMATEYEDNTFLALAYLNDSRYTTKINDYCNMHCQEVFEVELPDNYPYVDAGRYFKWTIKDSENDIAKASDGKLCAMDIDLDKVINDYQQYSKMAEIAAENLANMHCKDKYAVAPIVGASYSSCDDYASDYEKNCAPSYVCIDYRCGIGPCGVQQCSCAAALYGDDAKHWYAYIGGNSYSFPPISASCCPSGSCPNGAGTVTVSGASLSSIYIQSQFDICQENWNNYDLYVTNFESIVDNLSSELFSCNSVAQELELDMQIDLKYQTLFEEHDYSTEEGEIKKENIDGIYGDNYACIDSKDEECNIDYFTLSNRIDNLTCKTENATWVPDNLPITDAGKQQIINYAKGIEIFVKDYCEKHTFNNKIDCGDNYNYYYYWSGIDPDMCLTVEEKAARDECQKIKELNPNYETIGGLDSATQMLKSVGALKYDVEEPNLNHNNNYSASHNEFVSFTEYVLGDTFVYNPNIKLYGGDKNYWNTIYAGFVSTSDLYQLNEKINACICKDGEVRDKKDDGTCSCVREVSYKEFIETYNNYQELPDGTLSVEFMNGSGLYPIGLKYWILGSVDENGQGHFDTIVDDLGIEECANGECIYGDPYGVCRFVVKNRIIASPDDGGICEDPPCDDDDDDDGECENPPCDDDDDKGDCIVDGKPDPKCGDVSGLNVIYRIIDLDNPFPGADGNSRVPGKNWMGKENLITDNRDVSGMGVYSLEPLYSATLTPAAIREIRKDNHENMDGDYLKGTLVYPSNSPSVYGGGYSLFIHEELENIAVGYGGNFSIKIDNDERFSNILKTR